MTADERSVLPGRWALVTATGRAVLGNVEGVEDGRVRRQLFTLDGVLTPGMSASLETTIYAPDPEARGVEFAEVILERPYGDAPAWVTTGADDTWVVFAHDFGADRTESLRVLALFERLGLPVVIPTLRSDDETIDADRTDLGPTESHDVIAAIEFALGAGAQDIVLFGSGTGASSVLLAAADTRYTPRIAALVLDAPLLDPSAIADQRLGEDKVPGFLVGWAKAAATFRFGIDWTGLDYVASAADQTHPTLIFHGESDDRYPAEASQRYAAAASNTTLILVPEAGHGEAWNLDPSAYESALEDFLRDTAVGPAGVTGED